MGEENAMKMNNEDDDYSSSKRNLQLLQFYMVDFCVNLLSEGAQGKIQIAMSLCFVLSYPITLLEA